MNIEQLKVNPENPFPAKSDQDIIDLAAKIKRDSKFLEARPIVYDSDNDNVILGGNKRYAALLLLEYKTVPKKWLFDAKNWDEEERRRFIFADNFNVGEWNMDFIEEEEVDEWNIEIEADDLNLDDLEDIDFDNIKSNGDRSPKDNTKSTLCYNCGVNINI